MNKEIALSKISKAIALLVAALIAFIFGPVLCYFGGWIFGWLTKITIGGWFVATVNSVLGTTITAEMLPTLGGILGVVGHFFHGNGTIAQIKND